MRSMQTTNDTETTTTEAHHRPLCRDVQRSGRRPSAPTSASDVFADDGRLVDPLIDAVGPEQIAAAIGGLRDQMPGHSLARTTAVDAHHDQARFGWTVNGPDGTVAVAGIDVVTFDPDGRIQTAIGFFGDVAAS